MELLDSRHPIILIFGILGNLASIAVFFSPVPTFIDIYKQKSTMEYSSLPYLVSLFSASLWLFYASIKKGDVFFLITINLLGVIIQLIYIFIFILYARPERKRQTLKILSAIVTLFIVIFVGSSILLAPSIHALVVGWICVGVSICVFAAPLSNVIRVVKTKSIESMPFPLSCFLTISAIMWFAYGVLIVDICVSVPNIFGFILGVLQMILYQYYKHRNNDLSSDHIINTPNSEASPA